MVATLDGVAGAEQEEGAMSDQNAQIVEGAMKMVFAEDPVVYRLWLDDPVFHAALDHMRAFERHGGDPVYAAVSMLANLAGQLKRMKDREIDRLMKEPVRGFLR